MPTYRAPQRYYKRQASAAFLLTWRGREIEDKVNAASKAALEETLKACVDTARSFAPEEFGDLKADINYTPPVETAKRITARWGNFNVHYSIYQNYGTSRIPAVFYLERAADIEYRRLAPEIKKNFGNA